MVVREDGRPGEERVDVGGVGIPHDQRVELVLLDDDDDVVGPGEGRGLRSACQNDQETDPADDPNNRPHCGL